MALWVFAVIFVAWFLVDMCALDFKQKIKSHKSLKTTLKLYPAIPFLPSSSTLARLPLSLCFFSPPLNPFSPLRPNSAHLSPATLNLSHPLTPRSHLSALSSRPLLHHSRPRCPLPRRPWPFHSSIEHVINAQWRTRTVVPLSLLEPPHPKLY
jgi:hypothetical protein